MSRILSRGFNSECSALCLSSEFHRHAALVFLLATSFTGWKRIFIPCPHRGWWQCLCEDQIKHDRALTRPQPLIECCLRLWLWTATIWRIWEFDDLSKGTWENAVHSSQFYVIILREESLNISSPWTDTLDCRQLRVVSGWKSGAVPRRECMARIKGGEGRKDIVVL